MEITSITGIILAGGKASRMNYQDKGLLLLNNKPLYCYMAERLAPQVRTLIINANRNTTDYAQSGYPVITDNNSDFLGPLAGILSGLKYSKTDWLFACPCDMPFIPTNLVKTLWQGLNGQLAAFVDDGTRTHPTLLLLNKQVKPLLEYYLAKGDRKLQLFLAQINAQRVVVPNQVASFVNINTPEDLMGVQQ